MSWRNDAGIPCGSRSIRNGSFSTAARTSVTVSPANRRSPVNISNNTAPKAQMSARRSATRPLACSGLMYAAVPRITPAWVIAGEITVSASASSAVAPVLSRPGALARPKSTSFTVQPATSAVASVGERLPSGRRVGVGPHAPLRMMLAGLRSRWMMPASCAASSPSAICAAIGSASETSNLFPIRRSSVRPSTSSIAMAGMSRPPVGIASTP